MLLHRLALLACAVAAVRADDDEELPSRVPVPKGLNAQLLAIVQEKVGKGVTRNDGTVVEKLLSEGADASSVGEYNYTALMWAIVRRKPDVVQLLLDAGADTEYINAWGRNAMFLAAWEGQAEVMKALIRAGANVSASAQHDEWSPIHKVVEMGHIKLARQLIEAGANLNARTLPDKTFKEGVVPLKLAKTKKMRKLLEANGAMEEPPVAEPAAIEPPAEAAAHDEL